MIKKAFVPVLVSFDQSILVELLADRKLHGLHSQYMKEKLLFWKFTICTHGFKQRERGGVDLNKEREGVDL